MKTVLIALAVMLLFAPNAFCHAPSKIDLTRLGTEINVTVIHEVNDPRGHFVKHIAITVNGTKMIDQNFTMQTDDEMQQTKYIIPSLMANDKVEIEAECNQFGELKKEFTVGW